MGWLIPALLILALLPVPAAGQVYEWVDERGVRHFTDDLNRVPESHRSRVTVSPWGPAPSSPAPPAAPVPAAPPAGVPERLALPPRPALSRPDAVTRPAGPAASEPDLSCFPGAVAVTSRWDAALRRLHDLVRAVAAPDLHGMETDVVVIDGPDTLPSGGACGNPHRATIVVSLDALRQVQKWGDPEWILVRILTHEFAHLALHRDSLLDAWTHDVTAMEYEADELGIYYFEQAGYDCRTWVNSIGVVMVASYDSATNQRHALGAACDLARHAQRPARRLASP